MSEFYAGRYITRQQVIEAVEHGYAAVTPYTTAEGSVRDIGAAAADALGLTEPKPEWEQWVARFRSAAESVAARGLDGQLVRILSLIEVYISSKRREYRLDALAEIAAIAQVNTGRDAKPVRGPADVPGLLRVASGLASSSPEEQEWWKRLGGRAAAMLIAALEADDE